MKKPFILLLILFYPLSVLFAQSSPEYLIKQRDTAYSSYQTAEKQVRSDSSHTKMQNLIDKMDEVIAQDNDIIDLYSDDMQKIKTDSSIIEGISKENSILKNDINKKRNWIIYLIIVAAAVIGLAIISLIFFFISRRKSLKYREQYEIEKQIAKKYSEELQQKEFISEKENVPSISLSPQSNEKAGEIELHSMKLEKLYKLKESGLITQQEYEQKKQEILNSF
ncbi:MAG: SHOCT domain-containing protein [Bacteroidales bacterium]|nr:SHOCT domain-containing protein [Bacteroidales bacterium]